MSRAQELRDEIIGYIAASGIAFSDWYVGTAADPRVRLFTDHKVDTEAYWIYKDAGSEECARAIVEFIINTYKTKGLISFGDITMGDETARYVYAYAITKNTRQDLSGGLFIDEQSAPMPGIQKDK